MAGAGALAALLLAPAAAGRPGAGSGAPTIYVGDVACPCAVTVVDPRNRATRSVPFGGLTPDAFAASPDGSIEYVFAVSSDEPDAPAQLVPIRVATDTVARATALGDDPYTVAVDPDGASAYVVNGFGAAAEQLGPVGTITPVDLATGKHGKPIEAGVDPQAVTIALGGRRAFVLDADDDNGDPRGITPVNLATGTAGPLIHVPAIWLAGTPDGSTLYAITSKDVVPINAATGVPGRAIGLVGAVPAAFAFSPNGGTLYVVGTPDPAVEPASGSTATLTAVNTADDAVAKPVALTGLAATGSYDLAVTPNGSTVVVLSTGNGRTPSKLVRVTAGSPTASEPIAVGRGSDALVADPDGSVVYVLSPGSAYEGPPTPGGAKKSRGSVIPVDVASGALGSPIEVGYGADLMSIAG